MGSDPSTIVISVGKSKIFGNRIRQITFYQGDPLVSIRADMPPDGGLGGSSAFGADAIALYEFLKSIQDTPIQVKGSVRDEPIPEPGEEPS